MRALVSSWPAPSNLHVNLGLVRPRGKSLLFAIVSRASPKARSANSGRAMPSDNVAVGVLADHVVEEDVLGDDGVALHAHHLGNVGNAPGAVAQARGLNDDVDRGADHL